jgi:hypothetical protein
MSVLHFRYLTGETENLYLTVPTPGNGQSGDAVIIMTRHDSTVRGRPQWITCIGAGGQLYRRPLAAGAN